MNKREMKIWLRDEAKCMDTVESFMGEGSYRSTYLGSYMSLDPCGRYHHILSPNGATSKCERFWERLEEVASDRGGWIESGEGDPTDIYFCLPEEDKPRSLAPGA